ncbi:MAG TPA: hypothetical protein VHR45_02040 [Thermoanaerobaculia bacterium]|nr:hypothetical protein [Thermoanaerobaculia bacterium]
MTQAAFAGAAAAQSAAAPSGLPLPAAATGLEDIAASLRRIEILLRAQVEIQRVELLLKRADLVNQEVLPLQTELRQTKNYRDNLEEQQHIIEQQVKDFTDRMENLPRLATEVELKDAEQTAHHFEQQLRQSKARLQTQRARVEELESELGKRTVDRDDVRARLDRALARLESANP